MWRRRAAELAPIVAVVLVGVVAIGLNAGKARGYTHLILLSLTVVESAVALLFRRRHPVIALVGVLAVYAVFQVPPAMVLPVLVALLTVTTDRPGRVAALASLGTAAVVIGRPYVDGDTVDLIGQQLPLLLAIGVTVSLGTYLRRRRMSISAPTARRVSRATATRGRPEGARSDTVEEIR
jgi:hypothetical protein